MTPEQREKHKARQKRWKESLTAEQREQHKARDKRKRETPEWRERYKTKQESRTLEQREEHKERMKRWRKESRTAEQLNRYKIKAKLWRQSIIPEQQEKRRARDKRGKQSPKGREAQKRRRGLLKYKEYRKRYMKSLKGRLCELNCFWKRELIQWPMNLRKSRLLLAQLRSLRRKPGNQEVWQLLIVELERAKILPT